MNLYPDNVKQFDVYLADLGVNAKSVQSGVRPCCVVQGNIGNRYSPTVMVAQLTSAMDKPKLPTHVFLDATRHNLERNSIVLMEQMRVVSKQQLANKLTFIHDPEIQMQIAKAALVELGLGEGGMVNV